MKHKIFSIYDSKAEAYLPPFFMHHEALAVRAFQDAVNQIGHSFNLHPADYTLFNIGAWDDSDCKIVSQSPISLAQGITLVVKSSDQEQSKLLEVSK